MDTLLHGLEQAEMQWGFRPDDGQCERLIDYVMLMHRWNRIDNLSAVRDPVEMVSRHVLDSLSLSVHLKGDRILDLGTGAGLPGIPLAIANPEKRFHLIDSAAKRIRFVLQAIGNLGLGNVHAEQARAEKLRAVDGYDHVTSRAFTSLVDFSALAIPLLSEKGSVLAMKGRTPTDEMDLLTAQGLAVHAETLFVPSENADRCVVIIRSI